MVNRVSAPFDITVATEGPRATAGVSGVSLNVQAQSPKEGTADFAGLALGIASQYIQYETSQQKQDEGYMKGQSDALAKAIDADEVGFFQRKAYQEGVGRVSAVTAVSDMQARALTDMQKAIANGTDPVTYTKQLQQNAVGVLRNSENGAWVLNKADHQHVINGLMQTTDTLARQYKQVWDSHQMQLQQEGASTAVMAAARNVQNAATPEDVYKATKALVASQDIFLDPQAEYRIPVKDAANNLEQALKQLATAMPANGGPLDVPRINGIVTAVWDSPLYSRMPAAERTQLDSHLFSIRKDVMSAQAAAAHVTLQQMTQSVETPEFANRPGMVKPDLNYADQIVGSVQAAMQAGYIPPAAYDAALQERNKLFDAMAEKRKLDGMLNDPNRVSSDEDAKKLRKGLIAGVLANSSVSGVEAELQVNSQLYAQGAALSNPHIMEAGQQGLGQFLNAIAVGQIPAQPNPETKQPEFRQYVVDFMQELREDFQNNPERFASKTAAMDPKMQGALARAMASTPTGTSQVLTAQFRTYGELTRNGITPGGLGAIPADVSKEVRAGYEVLGKFTRMSQYLQNKGASVPDLFRGEIGPNERGRLTARMALDEATDFAVKEALQDRAKRFAIPEGVDAKALRNLVLPDVRKRTPDTAGVPTAPYSVQVARSAPALERLGEFKAQFLEEQYAKFTKENPSVNVLGATLDASPGGFSINLHTEHAEQPVRLPPITDDAVRDWDVRNRARLVNRAQAGNAVGTIVVQDHSKGMRQEVIETRGTNDFGIAGADAERFSKRLVYFEQYRSASDPKQGGVIGIGGHPSQGGDSLHKKFSAIPENERTAQKFYDLLVDDKRGLGEFYSAAKREVQALGFDFKGRGYQDVGARELLTYSAYLGGPKGATAVREVVARAMASERTPRQVLDDLRGTAVWKGGNSKSRPFMEAMVLQSIDGIPRPVKGP